MRWRWSGRALALGLAAVLVAVKGAAKDVTAKEFDAIARQGSLLLVEHYSPLCGHCQALAPTWEKLTLSRTSLEQEGTVIVQIDCTREQAVCKEHNIRAYPAIQLWEDGQYKEQYLGARSLENLQAYIDEKHAAHQSTFLRQETTPLNDAATAPESTILVPQPGIIWQSGLGHDVFSLNESSFDALHIQTDINSSRDVYFVKFFAPWCPHCKRLAPTWTALAKEPKVYRSLIVAEVDCTIQQNLCKKENIQSYPTLTIYRNGTKEDYQGPRTLKDLKAYAAQISDPGISAVKLDDVLRIEEQEVNFFVYLHEKNDNSYEDLVQYTTMLVGRSRLYHSEDKLLLPRFDIQSADLPALVAMQDYPAYRRNLVPRLPQPNILEAKELLDAKLVKQFIKSHQYPRLLEIDPETWTEAVLENPSKPIVLLAVLDNVQAKTEVINDLYRAAVQWAIDLQSTQAGPFADKAQIERHPRQMKREVIWAFIDAPSSERWLNRNFGVKLQHASSVIVVDSETGRFSLQNRMGGKIEPTPKHMLKALYDYNEGLLDTKSGKGLRTFVMSVSDRVYDLSGKIALFSIFAFILLYLVLNRHMLGLGPSNRRSLTGYEKSRGLLD